MTMNVATKVYLVQPDPGFAPLVPEPGVDLSEFEYLTIDDWEPVPMGFGEPGSPIPDFVRVQGLPGVLAVRSDEDANPSLLTFCWRAAGGHLFDLAGQAVGWSLFRPTVWRLLDQQASVGLGETEVTKYEFVANQLGDGLFRSVPRIGEIYCASIEDEHPIADLDDAANMDFVDWYQLAGMSGLSFTEIWRSAS